MALSALCSAMAQAEVPSACPGPDAVRPVHLYGEWSLTWWPDADPSPDAVSTPRTGRVRFERHPEFEGNVRGQVWWRTEAAPALLAGDVTDGELLLDESTDGQRIDAVWVGTPLDCARRFEGTRRAADGALSDPPVLRFRLQKTPGWR
ncbi:MAG TPA: hypothetical protein PKC60_11900 [Hydrogenophaga sp.]|uniref:hypothetical protein n=1 Tax=Hydrogenophaga sp. TaxID=1904254 RepID=UPI002C7CCE14|nr:hypothetical protein [Hydrogenophaga sp.]HMN93921.1 hypothetical protein [Hydrogenophaga sp.]HMP12037.1 hypothetical protein [Hydrogenophaga sp.]